MLNYYYLGLILLCGLIAGRIFSKIKFPEVTGYLVIGIIIGPSVLGLISSEGLSSLTFISDIALSFIAFSIGSSLDLNILKKNGSKIISITFAESFFAFIFVFMGFWLLLGLSFAFSITIASIATATAPAATLMVIQQYKAKGPLVDLLLPVVSLDDAFCIMFFGIGSSIASTIINAESINIIAMFAFPILEIFFALIVGAISGAIFVKVSKYIANEAELTSFIIAFILIVTAISLKLDLSSLLTIMMMSFMITNFSASPMRYHHLVDRLTPPLFMAFFVVSGADLELSSLISVGLLGLVYIFMRVFGKVFGAYISTKLWGMPASITNNLGLTLIPQAGVAIGLSAIALQIFPDPYGTTIRTIILGATIVYELLGPLLSKYALKRSGAIHKNA